MLGQVQLRSPFEYQSLSYMKEPLLPRVLCWHAAVGLLAVVLTSLDQVIFSNARFDRVVIELLILLCTFENSTECSKISFDCYHFRIAQSPISDCLEINLIQNGYRL